METKLRRHAPGKAFAHEASNASAGCGKARRRILVALRLGGVENIADAAVKADFAAGNGDKAQTRVGNLEEQDARENFARLFVDLAVRVGLFHSESSFQGGSDVPYGKARRSAGLQHETPRMYFR